MTETNGPQDEQVGYDEFSMFADNASEAGIEWRGPPTVERVSFAAPSGNLLSGLRWGAGRPRLVLLHGGAQNAHTWDTVALALGEPALAIDLPGHGHSDWRADRAYRPQETAADIAAMIADHHGSGPVEVLAGMSLGGLTALVAAADDPGLTVHLALVDITPGVNREKAKDIIDFVGGGPETFASFDEILERTVMFNPTRSESSLRRGILHNAHRRTDGRWAWRYDLPMIDDADELDHRFADLWAAVDAVTCPLSLYQGARSPVVDDADVAELLRRRPTATHVVVDDAGHSIQGDQPVELARLLRGLLED